MLNESTRETDLIIYAALKSIAEALRLLRSGILSVVGVYERRLGKVTTQAEPSTATYTTDIIEDKKGA